MRGFIVSVGVVLVLVLVACPTANAVVDLSKMEVASVAPGCFFGAEPAGWRLLEFNGNIYFAPWGDGSANPSKVFCYNPANGLSNGVNHTTLAETTGRFTTMKEMGGSLYMADSTGTVRAYNGTTVSTIAGTPFTASNYVNAMTQFNGQKYFGTSSGHVYEYNGSAFPEVLFPGNWGALGSISDIVGWKDSLYVSTYQTGVDNGYAAKSNGSDVSSWQKIISNVACGSEVFLPTDQYLYATTADHTSWHGSTVRRSSNGVDFTTISGPGPFKFPVGNPMLSEGVAYIFENGRAGSDYDNGFLITDDGTTTTMTEMATWDHWILAATELNGQIYAIGLDHGYNVAGNVYLLTTIPEPSTLGLLGIGAMSLLAYVWRRRRRTA
jgi:hypothetical protein